MLAVILAVGVLSTSPHAAEADAPRPPIGATMPNLEFKDIRYLTRSLDEFGPRRAYVIVATSPTCPVAQRYLPVLAEMEPRFRERGVQFLGLDVGYDTPITEVAASAVEAGVPFPFTRDEGLRAARALGLRRTPEVAVLDARRVLRYRGRIDDQFRVAGDRSGATRHELRDALEAVLTEKALESTETPVDGCLIPRPASESIAKEGAPPTYSRDIVPILAKHCAECHRAGTEAPFALATYRDTIAQAPMIEEVVADRRMPPWFASARHGSFTNRRGLSDAERDTLLAWLRGGTPRGELDSELATSAARLPAPKWRIGEPDLVLTMPLAQSVPATGFVDYKYTVFPRVFPADTWVQSVEILPDNPRVVHHANLAYTRIGDRPREENFITGRVPGGDPMVLDEGTAYLIPKGSVVGLQIHYTTTGRPETARISVGFRFPRAPVQKRLYHQQVNNRRFCIPPHAPAHAVEATRTLEFDATGVGLFSHMHLRGADMTFLAKRPGAEPETLLLIPNYNFDWQQSYRWAPGRMRFPRGTTLEVVAHFDNSAFNPFNPDPSATVGNGDQTFDEMMYGFYFYTRDDENLNLTIDPRSGAEVRSR